MRRAIQFYIFGFALAALAGCSESPAESVAIRVSSWLPSAAMKYSSASLDGLDNSGGLDPKLSPKPVVEVAAVIGAPLTQTGPWPIRLVVAPGSIEQAILVKTVDNRYFSTAYVWRDDPILGGCVDYPQQCSRFEWPRQIGEEEAKALLPESWQYTPALYRRFFGTERSTKTH